MRRFLRLTFTVAFVLLLVAAVLAGRMLYVAGYFNEIKPQFAGTCTTVEGAVGVEDLEIDRANGTIYLSSQDRRPGADGVLKPGTIFIGTLDDPKAPLRASVSGIESFHPHGISLFTDASGRQTLAVLNHPSRDESEVVLFDVSRAPGIETTLTVRRTVKSSYHLNDVTLVSHESFYATNDRGSKTSLGAQLETWLLLPRSNVIYYDGSVESIAASGFNYANGINRNADGTEIYVAETTGRTLSTFRRDPLTGTLSHIHSLAIPMGLDNIDVDADGNLWIGAHPHLLDFLAHAQDPKKLSPSAVVKVKPEGETTTYETIYVNAGEEISGSSVAASANGRLLIGAVFDPKFLNCTLTK